MHRPPRGAEPRPRQDQQGYNWRRRCEKFGIEGLRDRSKRPHTKNGEVIGKISTCEGRIISDRRRSRCTSSAITTCSSGSSEVHDEPLPASTETDPLLGCESRVRPEELAERAALAHVVAAAEAVPIIEK